MVKPRTVRVSAPLAAKLSWVMPLCEMFWKKKTAVRLLASREAYARHRCSPDRKSG
jgi:hypothetical protein